MGYNVDKVLESSDLTWLGMGTFYLTKHGSTAYGTNLPSSDIDYKGIAVPPSRYFDGFLHRFEQAEFHHQTDGVDMVVFDVRKFFRLAADCNPSIIEVLFTEPEDRVIVTAPAEAILSHRDMFLSKKAKHTFGGYAVSQLKKLQSHRRWLKFPPPAKPRFGATLQEWRHYETWLENRNKERPALEAKFGYDTKHGMHLVRLLRMGVEILRDQKVLVKRPDAQELLEIRAGAWTYERLLEYAQDQLVLLDDLYKTSTLPDAPDRNALDRLCSDIVSSQRYGW